MTTPTTDTCDACGYGRPDPLARAKASALPSPADHAEMPKRLVGRTVVRTCSCGKPWPCEQSRWAALRAEIEKKRATACNVAAGLSDEEAERFVTGRAFGRVDGYDEVLATMDRMEAGR